MKVAVLLLTCGRPEMTRETWVHNLSRAGYPFSLFWFDNGSTEPEYNDMLSLTIDLPIEWFYYSKENKGIAIGLNRMIEAAFRRGYDAVVTMANDILEPDNWLLDRVQASVMVPNTGVVSIPVETSTNYAEKESNGIRIKEGGQVIGNYLITKAAYEAIGLFTTQYGHYGPIDLDYCDRLRQVGMRFYYLLRQAKHIGLHEANPIAYQQAKDASLKASWQQYTYNTHSYARGEHLFQFDLGPGEGETGGVDNL